MMMAATFAGMGFGNSGVHIPHANAYPIAGMVRDYIPAGYPPDEPMVPHGQSVSLTAPEAFRFSFSSAPERHLRAAWLMDPDADKHNDEREQLPSVLVRLMRDIDIPNGIGGVGYTEADVPDLVPGTMKQQRLLATCPEDADRGRHRRHPDPLHPELVAARADLRVPLRMWAAVRAADVVRRNRPGVPALWRGDSENPGRVQPRRPGGRRVVRGPDAADLARHLSRRPRVHRPAAPAVGTTAAAGGEAPGDRR
jgi:hypothetical protein